MTRKTDFEARMDLAERLGSAIGHLDNLLAALDWARSHPTETHVDVFQYWGLKRDMERARAFIAEQRKGWDAAIAYAQKVAE